jgi:hypothetical protein
MLVVSTPPKSTTSALICFGTVSARLNKGREIPAEREP